MNLIRMNLIRMDGYGNLYERALGMDSLGFDREAGPRMPSLLTENPSFFVCFDDPQTTTGENFIYSVEESSDLHYWSPASVNLESEVHLGAGMKRLTYVSNTSTLPTRKTYLRLKISKF